MEHIIKKTPVNLSYIIIMQMKETVRKAKSCLPYGMMLTLLFKSQRVSLEGEDGIKLHHTDVYTSKTLERMGYFQVEGVWRKKGTNVRAIGSSSSEEEEEEENVEAAGTSSAPLLSRSLIFLSLLLLLRRLDHLLLCLICLQRSSICLHQSLTCLQLMFLYLTTLLQLHNLQLFNFRLRNS